MDRLASRSHLLFDWISQSNFRRAQLGLVVHHFPTRRSIDHQQTLAFVRLAEQRCFLIVLRRFAGTRTPTRCDGFTIEYEYESRETDHGPFVGYCNTTVNQPFSAVTFLGR